jgi:hypothetical protein
MRSPAVLPLASVAPSSPPAAMPGGGAAPARPPPRRARAPPASPPGPGGRAAARLVGRLDEVRALGRARRLRIQLPLLLAGGLIGVSGLCLGVGLHMTISSVFGMALGPYLVLLCVMPGVLVPHSRGVCGD